MKEISDSDFRQAFLLLLFLAKAGGTTLHQREASRKAGLLVRKWDKKMDGSG